MAADGEQQQPTLEMVGALAGVSRATVSRVVNGSAKVAPGAVAAVEAAIAQLDYVPNRAARSLAGRRTNALALVMPEQTERVFADPFFASLIQGAMAHLATTEHTLTLLISSPAQAEKTRRFLLGGNVDGVLVVSHHSGDATFSGLRDRLPVVFAGRPLREDDRDAPTVDVDNVGAARVATEHLIARGRTRIATVAGRQDMPAGIDRLRGFQEAMTAAGLDPTLVEVGDFSPASGADAMRALLARGEPIDGVFAASDRMAAGVYTALRERGLRVPEDVGVVGFDDDYLAESAVPPLTTVRQPNQEFGRAMAEVLLRLVAGEAVDPLTLVPTTLVVRQSS
ncbi:HTH-type transcriptional repressor CytR [Clavibacter michiganensis]|uniref:HTH-type transcriptional repressor CytR n=2 Tax=Clavibacter michiganensis TaxID=28447 RepID=A0A251Y4B4_9MICO|nr:HTH-type transcriptional repressor CytR [Clavibacter michiganensis]